MQQQVMHIKFTNNFTPLGAKPGDVKQVTEVIARAIMAGGNGTVCDKDGNDVPVSWPPKLMSAVAHDDLLVLTYDQPIEKTSIVGFEVNVNGVYIDVIDATASNQNVELVFTPAITKFDKVKVSYDSDVGETQNLNEVSPLSAYDVAVIN